MYSVDDFKNILDYLTTGDDTSGLSTKIIACAMSEQATTAKLFEETIDQDVFSSEDFKKLRSLMINWYASLRTLYTLNKTVSDINAMPEDYLIEAFKSHGFVIGESFKNIPYDDKIKLYYDLNNLYKIKGTPESIFKMLNYFGLPDVDIVEYWLEKDEKNKLIFKADVVMTSDTTSTNKPYTNIPYAVTEWDPHWMITKTQMEEMLKNSQIQLPSKSPYFGIRPLYNLDDFEPILAILSNYMEYQYIQYKKGIPQDKKYTTYMGYKLSIFELYIATIYSFKLFYGDFGTTSGKKLYYSGDQTSVHDIIYDYRDRIKRPLARTELARSLVHPKTKIDVLRELYTEDTSQSFLYIENVAQLLHTLCPNIKDEIDISFENASEDIIKDVTADFSDAINDYFKFDEYTKFNLGSYLFDFDEYSLSYIKETINFFKPYKSRIQFSEKVYNIKNPLENTVIADDDFKPPTVYEDIVSLHTAGGKPSLTSTDDYNRNRYDSRTYYDLGVGNDSFQPPVELSDSFLDVYNHHRKNIDTGYFFTCDGTTILDGTNISTTITDMYVGGGYQKFDTGWSFDSGDGNDLLNIKIYPVIPEDKLVMWYNMQGPEFNKNDYPIGNAAISAPSSIFKNGEVEFTNLETDTVTLDVLVNNDQTTIDKLKDTGRIGIILDDSLEDSDIIIEE